MSIQIQWWFFPIAILLVGFLHAYSYYSRSDKGGYFGGGIDLMIAFAIFIGYVFLAVGIVVGYFFMRHFYA